MKPAAFDYEKPRTLAEAIRLLGNANAKAIAGGQSLGPMLNLRLAQPELLVDLRGLPELREAADERDAVVLGACTTHAAIEDGRVPDATRGLLRHVARGIAYRAVRNRGTLGGSLAHADPAADWVSVMALLDAEIRVCGVGGERRLRASNFFDAALTTFLAADEIIVGVAVPKLTQRARWSYWKFCRKTGEYAEAIAAFVVDPERSSWRAVLGATGGAPYVIADARELDPDAASADAGFERGSYEHRVHAVALRRAAAQLA